MKELTIAEAEDFFSVVYRGKHHIPSKIRDDGGGVWSVSHYTGGSGLATFDFDELTVMVILAHDRCVRLWIKPGGARALRICIAKRDRRLGLEDVALWHPTIEEAVAKFRESRAMEWWRWVRYGKKGV